jgi:hypothetical protein
MSGLFRRRQEPAATPAPLPPVPPAARPEPNAADGSQTLYVSGDRQRDTDRIRLLVDSLREVSSAADHDALLVTMVDRAVALVRAERGMLFTIGPDGAATLRVSRAANGTDLPRAAAYSSKVVESVLGGGKSVCQKVGEDTDFDPSRSMIDLNIRAVMCVPLVARDKRLGVLMVDTRASERTFSRGDLRYFEAIADMLAIVWTNREAEDDRLRGLQMKRDLLVARDILRRMNRSLGGDISADMFMSMFLCVLDPNTREFSYANAGQTKPVLLHAQTLETEDYRVTGTALGVESETDYEERGPFRLEAGDTVVMFSDGLTELRREGQDEQYGRTRVIQSILMHANATAEDLLDALVRDALAWAGNPEEHKDDVTVAVLRADA